MIWNPTQIKNLKFTAIRSLTGDAGEFEISGEGIVKYLDGTAPFTDTDVSNEMVRIQAEYDAAQYARDRVEAYPAVEDQLDMIFHAIEAGTLDTTSEFFTTLKAVKDANPKA
jgi:hypothetical protein